MKPPKYEKSLKSQKLANENLTLIYKEKPARPRQTIVINKKIALKAVDRNRIKRIIKEALRVSKINIENKELIIIVKRNIASLKTQDVQKQLNQIIKKPQNYEKSS